MAESFQSRFNHVRSRLYHWAVAAQRYSMPDWAFFPAAFLAFIAVIVLANQIRPAGAEPIVTDREFLMNGAALSRLVPGPGTAVQLVTATGQPLARMNATASLEAAGTLSAGVAAIIPPAFEAAVIGRTLRVEAEWRSGDGARLTSARLGYFTTGGGDSGWRALPVEDRFTRVAFCFEVPAAAPRNEIESMGIWPDETGSSLSLIVREMRTVILDEGTTLAQCEAGLPPM